MKYSAAIVALVMRFPRRLMLGNLLAVLVIGIGLGNLTVESGIDVFFSDDDPNLLAEKQLEKVYGQFDNILIVIDTLDEGLFQPTQLSAIEKLTDAAWQTPSSRRVDSISNYQFPSVDGDDIFIGDLIEDAAALSPTELQAIRTTALNQQALVGRLLSISGNTTAVNISLYFPDQDRAERVEAAVTFARELARDLERETPSLKTYLAGTALTEQTLAEVTGADAVSLMPLLFVLVLVLISLLLRSFVASLCTVIAIALSIMTGMGYAGWQGIGLNSVNVSAPTIIMTLAVADCIHLLSVFLVQLRQGEMKSSALANALAKTLYPIFLTSLTTAMGFMSMNYSDSPPFQELGTISAVGVIGALWVTVTILPGLIMLLPFGTRKGQKTGIPLAGLARLVTRHHTQVFVLSLIFIATSAAFLSRIELNDDPTTYFSDAVPLTEAMDIIETRLSGTQSIDYSMNSAEAGGIADPTFLRQVDEFVQWLRQQPEVVNVESYTDTLKRLNQVMHNDDLAWFRLPQERAMAAQYTLLYEMSVPYGLDVTHQVSADKRSLKVTATLKNQRSAGLIVFEQRSRQWLESHSEALATRGAGQSISFSHIGMRNIKSMFSGSIMALVLVSACLVIAFRSLRYGLISLIPNLFPALVALGIWGALVGQVNMAASVVFSLTLGIIVDDTTHFLTSYLRAKGEGGCSAPEAVRQTIEGVGSALVSTSLILATGFAVLVQSEFAVNSTSGLLVALTITVAIVLDLFFLPALLIKMDRWLTPSTNKGNPQ